MAIHGPHPAGYLNDGCERCEEQALNPWFELDRENLRNLLWRALGKKEARSQLEAQAMKRINDTLDRCGAMYAASPEIVVSRLMDWS